MTDFDGFRMYFGAANGSAQKALRKMEEPHVMLSAVTHMNSPWPGIQDLFVDCGGYSMMVGGGQYESTPAEYVEFAHDIGATRLVLRDLPCEPNVREQTGKTVLEHQEETLEEHIQTLAAARQRGIGSRCMAVLQGWERNEYLEHFDMLRDHGLVTDRMGIGSVCRRGQTGTIRDIIRAVREAVPQRVELHAFGVKQTVLSAADIREALASADSSAWYYGTAGRQGSHEPLWHKSVEEYIQYRRKLRNLFGEIEPRDPNQKQLPIDAADGGTLVAEGRD